MSLRYQHAIWDWNGTLLNDTWLCVEVLNHLLAKRGRDGISEDEYRQNFGFPVIHFYEFLGFDVDVDSFDAVSKEFIGAYEERWLEECVLHTQASETLAQLSRLGMSHSVLSAAKQEALETGIKHFGIREHFLALVGTDNIYARGKVEQGRHWIQQLQWKPEEIVLIGDTLHDFEVAEAMGTDCILMAHGHHCPKRLAETSAPIVHSLQELIEHLSQSTTI
ncbi:HAD family hydrolase [Coraliomargarita akajimensis]|uniref:phosphoglycolate phosphatase n=1 Tax=Coraliomargarita akajimensis (strain DSM 45221 / IAM 15411 / JCM 23193 / KCTC 12865 / 04OKA010-24) TaxID=583355 RepID=D5ELH7_CORAD|nr:HAD family hydrolase [Coraliomargarita akajimensis]ADE55113.1 Haloacid dehalogenase domain protein hydrolase [Coraliomargarita akajimensis DSM 45221]